MPVFGAKDGYISARLVRNQINAASCQKTGEPLDPIELAALDFLDSLAYDPAIHLDMDLQVGDMQLCNNLDDPAFAYRLRGLAGAGATAPHDPSVADVPGPAAVG